MSSKYMKSVASAFGLDEQTYLNLFALTYLISTPEKDNSMLADFVISQFNEFYSKYKEEVDLLVVREVLPNIKTDIASLFLNNQHILLSTIELLRTKGPDVVSLFDDHLLFNDRAVHIAAAFPFMFYSYDHDVVIKDFKGVRLHPYLYKNEGVVEAQIPLASSLINNPGTIVKFNGNYLTVVDGNIKAYQKEYTHRVECGTLHIEAAKPVKKLIVDNLTYGCVGEPVDCAGVSREYPVMSRINIEDCLTMYQHRYQRFAHIGFSMSDTDEGDAAMLFLQAGVVVLNNHLKAVCSGSLTVYHPMLEPHLNEDQKVSCSIGYLRNLYSANSNNENAIMCHYVFNGVSRFVTHTLDTSDFQSLETLSEAIGLISQEFILGCTQNVELNVGSRIGTLLATNLPVNDMLVLANRMPELLKRSGHMVVDLERYIMELEEMGVNNVPERAYNPCDVMSTLNDNLTRLTLAMKPIKTGERGQFIWDERFFNYYKN